jgi:hypothetical protein
MFENVVNMLTHNLMMKKIKIMVRQYFQKESQHRKEFIHDHHRLKEIYLLIHLHQL